MTRNFATLTVALATLACATPLQAHHSVSMFDLASPVWVKGTVVNFEVKNPHVMMTLESNSDSGQIQLLTVEGPNVNRFTRMMGADEQFLKPGDVIEVCGFPFKGDIVANAASQSKTLPAYHGHVLVMPNGKMRLYGPYGKLENCVRPHDKPETWLDFVNADPLGQQAWCHSSVYATFRSTAPVGFLEEVNHRMTNPCR